MVEHEPAWDYHFACEIDPSGTLSVAQTDERLAGLLGFSENELDLPGAWVRVLPPEDVARTLETMNGLVRGEEWEGRVRLRASSGETLVLQVRSIPARREDGHIEVSIHARDVTHIAQLERLLAEDRARLGLLDKELSLAMWKTDAALRFTWSSGTIFGREDSLVGASLYDFFEAADPSADPIAAHEGALRGETTSYDVKWEDRYLRCLLEPLRNELGEIAGVLAVAVDLEALLTVGRSKAPAPFHAEHDGIHPSLVDNVTNGIITIGKLAIDPRRFEVRKNGHPVSLTVTEFHLLTEFARHAGSALTREVLAERVWGHPSYADSTAVTMAISRLRDKIEDDPRDPKVIETVRGVGYRMADDPADP